MSISSMRNRFSLAFVVVMILAGCSDDPPPPGPSGGNEPIIELKQQTVSIPADSNAIIQSIDTTGEIVISATSVYAESLGVGDVIIGRDETKAPNGFLRKVTSKTVQGDSAILQTSQATLLEAFDQIDLSESHVLRPANVKSYETYSGATFKSNQDTDTFYVDLACVLFDYDNDPLTTDDQIRMDGSLNFTAELFVDIEQSLLSLERFETRIETHQGAEVSLAANFHWRFEKAKEIDLATFHLGAIPIGGFIYVVPTLTVEAHVLGDLTVHIETSIEYSQQVTLGFGYENGVFYDIGEATKDFSYSPPSLSAELNFEAGASVNASCLLYGVAGPYMAGRAGFHFQSILSADLCDISLSFDLEAILYAIVGIECDVLNLDYNKPYQLYIHPIGEWTFPLGGSGNIHIDPEPDSLNAAWTLTGPCGYSTSGAGDMTLTELNPGDYTITWGSVTGWTAPSNSIQTLAAEGTITFSGTYEEEGGSITMPVTTTASVTSIKQTTAQCGGNVTSDGGAAVTARGVCWSTSPTPTISDSKTTDGSGTGGFTSSLTGLTANTPYYVRAYATNIEGTGYGQERYFSTGTDSTGTVWDIDGNVYRTVKIGDQWWMMENLKVTHYRNGDPIPNVIDNATWSGLNTGAYCNYNNDVDNVDTYGRLYNWHAAVDPREIAPEGWRVPNDEDWKQLEMYLGMSQTEADGVIYRGTDEGGKLKETGTTHWLSPNTGATNQSGFSALPGGRRDILGPFISIGSHAIFWSSTEFDSDYAWYRFLYYMKSQVHRSGATKRAGLSIRCIRD